MSYADFLNLLSDNGRINLPSPAPLCEEELLAGDEALAAAEQEYRLEMPGEPPVFSPPAARWAAVRFFRACQFAVYRDVDAAVMTAELAGDCGDVSPAAHYSVDLTFRFLPDLVRLAASASPEDPLMDHLRRWAGQWPLSSVGMEGIVPLSIDAIAASPSLLQLYADRIIARGDSSRLADERVRSAVESSLGMYHEMAALDLGVRK